jgi:hypothetical protein
MGKTMDNEYPDHEYPNKLLVELVYFIHSKKPYLKDFAKFRMRCEGWLKGEILHFLSNLQTEAKIDYFEPEKSYGEKGRCDVFFKANSQDYWMEMKTFPTNYCRYFSRYKSKPITMFIHDAKEDLEKLKSVENVKGNPIFVMLAYPIPDITMPLPDSSAIRRWWSHVEKLKENGFEKTIESSIYLEEGAECRIYIFMRGFSSQLLIPEKQEEKNPIPSKS